MTAPIEVPATRAIFGDARIAQDIASSRPRDYRVAEQSSLPSARAQPVEEAAAARAAVALISGKWTVDVLLAIRDRPLQFGMLSRALDHIARKVLTQTLRCMQRDGLIWRRTSGMLGKPVEYGLTPLGASLLESVASLVQWSLNHTSAVEVSRASFDAILTHQQAPLRRRLPCEPA